MVASLVFIFGSFKSVDVSQNISLLKFDTLQVYTVFTMGEMSHDFKSLANSFSYTFQCST